MRLFITAMLFFMALATMALTPAQAEDTDVAIYVKERGGTFIGTSMGGARIVIRDKITDDIIYDGITIGEPGDAEKLVGEKHGRDDVIVADDTAKLEFSLDLFQPMPVTITATGPLSQPQSLVSVTKDFILLPNRDYTAENGILLELSGLVVDIAKPAAGEAIPFDAEVPVDINVNVSTISGGMPATDGHWTLDRYVMQTHIYKDARFISSVPLEYSGAPGRFYTKLKIPKSGTFQIVVTVTDKYTKETGMDTTSLVLVEK